MGWKWTTKWPNFFQKIIWPIFVHLWSLLSLCQVPGPFQSIYVCFYICFSLFLGPFQYSQLLWNVNTETDLGRGLERLEMDQKMTKKIQQNTWFIFSSVWSVKSVLCPFWSISRSVSVHWRELIFYLLSFTNKCNEAWIIWRLAQAKEVKI